MLFAFRGMRGFQVLLVLITLVTGVGSVLILKAYTDGGSWLLMIGAVVLGLAFIWSFAAALRAPTSYVAVAVPEGRTRIRFAGLVDTVLDNKNIVGARLVRRRLWWGLGLRSNLRGEVDLLSAWGDAVELTLRYPIRIWLVPRLIPLRAHRLVLSLRNPQKLVDHFGAPPASPAAATARKMGRRGPRTR